MLDTNITKRMRDRRKVLNISRQLMADKLHVTKWAYDKWEQGAREPSIADLCLIAEILHTSVAYLLGERREITEMNEKELLENLNVCLKDAPKPVFYAGLEEVENGWRQYSQELNTRKIAEDNEVYSLDMQDNEFDWEDLNLFLPMVHPVTHEVYAIRDYGRYMPRPVDILLYTDLIPFSRNELSPNKKQIESLAAKAIAEYENAISEAIKNANGKLPAILLEKGAKNNYVAYSIKEKKPFVAIEYKNFLDTCQFIDYDDYDSSHIRENDKYYITPPTEDYIEALGLDMFIDALTLNLGWDVWRPMPLLPCIDAKEKKWNGKEQYIELCNQAVKCLNKGRTYEFKNLREEFGRLECCYKQFLRLLELEAPEAIISKSANLCKTYLKKIQGNISAEDKFLSSIFAPVE